MVNYLERNRVKITTWFCLTTTAPGDDGGGGGFGDAAAAAADTGPWGSGSNPSPR
jgi:hypothetical protein